MGEASGVGAYVKRVAMQLTPKHGCVRRSTSANNGFRALTRMVELYDRLEPSPYNRLQWHDDGWEVWSRRDPHNERCEYHMVIRGDI